MNPEERINWEAMQSAWIAAGLDPARFWDVTVKEVDREIGGMMKARDREANERMWLAWHIVALDRSKKLPKLETLLIKQRSPVRPRPQTPEQKFAAMKAIFLAFGGDPAELGLTNDQHG